jgi:hypothetical protein
MSMLRDAGTLGDREESDRHALSVNGPQLHTFGGLFGGNFPNGVIGHRGILIFRNRPQL